MTNWKIYVAHFFAAFFLVNSIPHIVQGLSGNRLPTPFARPPGVGESSPVINVLWGFFNLVAGYLLLASFVGIAVGGMVDTLVLVGGALFTAIVIARHFDRVRNKSY